jgi:CubicO group peptidase (beta-lactamase class C family)
MFREAHVDGATAKASGFDADELAKIPPLLQSAVDTGSISGIVSLIWRKGEEVQFNAVGQRNVEAGTPMTRDTIFRIASMTKPITSVAALMLLEEGKLKLDDPITKWAPEFADARVLKDAQGPLDQTYPAPRAITIEDLMTHRSGIAYGFSSEGPIREAYERALGDPLATTITPDAWMEAIGSLPLSYPPGERFHYGHSTDVLGLIVGRIEGKPFRDVLMERIFAPLGMKDTDFWIPPDKRGRAAALYNFNEEAGKLVIQPGLPYEAPPAFAGGGGSLVSTVDDYLKFARVMVRDGAYDGVTLLKPETARMMRTNRLTDAQRAIPFLGMGFWWQSQGFGLGVSTITDPEKHILGAGGKGAFGWPGIFGTWWQADPAQDMILIWLVQNSVILAAAAGGAAATAAAASQAPNPKLMPARLAQPMFQRHAYAALKG